MLIKIYRVSSFTDVSVSVYNRAVFLPGNDMSKILVTKEMYKNIFATIPERIDDLPGMKYW